MSLALVVAPAGNQSMARAIATPTTDATRPITSIRKSGCLSRSSRTAGSPPRGCHGARSYSTARLERDAGGARRAALARHRRHAGARCLPLGAAEARGGRAVMAPEGLCELGRLPVADAVGHV